MVEGEIKRFRTDVNLGLYSEEVAGEVVRRHVRKFLGEKLMSPSEESFWVGRDGSLDPDYLAMMQRSVAYWDTLGDKKAVARFEAELEGAKNLVTLVTEADKIGESVPVVINASDPGTFYVDPDGVKKSVTFVSVLMGVEGGGWRYRQFSLPTRFIGLERHWEIVQAVGDVQKTEELLKRSLGELTAESLIAFPVTVDNFLHSLDELAELLGYKDWNEVESMAQDQLRLVEDSFAKERREFMVEDFSHRIIEMISREKRSEENEEALVSAMSDTFALEKGGVYVGWDIQKIGEEIRKTVKLAQVVRGGKLDSYPKNRIISDDDLFYQMEELVAHRSWLMHQFETNELAREARASGCGGSGISLFGRGGFETNWVGNQLGLPQERWDNAFSYVGVTTDLVVNDNEQEPEGRFENGEYKPGECAICGKRRKKVWHKADGGCNCCTTCEHRLAGIRD